MLGNSQCEHQKDLILPFTSLFSDKRRVNFSLPFVVLAANRRKRKRTNRFNGDRGNWKKKKKNVIATTKTAKMSQFCRDVLSERTDTIWQWMMKSEVDLTNHVTVSCKKTQKYTFF